LPAAAVTIAMRAVLLRATQSQNVEMAIQGAAILVSTVVLYVVFTWAAEYDRRNPRDR
jgi:antitoxin component of MazEF toxin-antitoxin module